MIKTIISNILLALGGWALFGGILLLSIPAAELPSGSAGSRWFGVFLAGAGLAITVREFAYQLGERLRDRLPD